MKFFTKKLGFKVALIIGIFLAIGLAVMPWIGEAGVASEKGAVGGALWIHFLGKLHPLLLHLPIGVLVLVFVMEGLGLVSFGRYQAKTTLALGFAVLSSLLAVIFGYFLYLSGDFTGELVEDHKRDGILFAIAVIAAFLLKLALDVGIQKKGLKVGYYGVLGISGLLMMSAGHHGGEITHGDPLDALPSKVLAKRAEQKAKPVITDPIVYTDIIHPILEERCISCHGADKKKGGLRLDSYEAIVEGGDFADTLVPGDAKKSALISTLHLPLEDDEHMPPESKPQPTAEEISLLTWWVNSGASATAKLSELEVTPDVTTALSSLVSPEEQARIEAEKAKKAEQEELALAESRQKTKEHWESINGKFPGALNFISQQDPGLTFNIVSYRNSFKDADLAVLLPIKEKIIELDLSAGEVTDAVADTVIEFKNLKRLKIGKTEVTDAFLEKCQSLESLTQLNLFGTKVTDQGIQHLYELPNLKRVFLWNTEVTPEGAKQLEETLNKNQEGSDESPAKVILGV